MVKFISFQTTRPQFEYNSGFDFYSRLVLRELVVICKRDITLPHDKTIPSIMEPENMQLVTHIYVYSNSPKHPYLPIFPVCPPALVILLYDIGAGPEITLSPRGDLCAVTFTPVLDVFCREIIPGGITDDVLPVRTFPEFGCNLHARPLALNVRRKCGLKCDSRQVVSESENLVSLSDT